MVIKIFKFLINKLNIMPYSIDKFNEIKKTDKYKQQMRQLNKKSY